MSVNQLQRLFEFSFRRSSSGMEKSIEVGNSDDPLYDENLGTKLAVIEEVRAILGKEGIACPGVLVVGAQSAGKSSVMERLTGIPFPNGGNICTRVPTILHLNNGRNGSARQVLVSDNADFKNAISCSDVKHVSNAIEDITKSIVSSTGPVVDRPIHIRYTRKTGPVMTIIDLPGITHVEPNHKEFDIHSATSAMVKKYAENENMITLVVIPANDDFSNSEALKIAQSFDHDGSRTIGVVTKCDFVSKNSDIVQKLRMERDGDVKLNLGYVAVRNNGPSETTIDIEWNEALLFRTHPGQSIRASRVGVQNSCYKNCSIAIPASPQVYS